MSRWETATTQTLETPKEHQERIIQEYQSEVKRLKTQLMIAIGVAIVIFLGSFVLYEAYLESQERRGELAQSWGEEHRETRAAREEKEKIEAILAHVEADLRETRQELQEIKAEQLQRNKNRTATPTSQRTSEFFDLYLQHASLLSKREDHDAVKRLLQKSHNLDDTVSPTQRHARNLLKWFAQSRGSGPEKTLEGGKGGLLGLAWSRDGKWLVSGSETGTLLVFDAETDQLVKQLQAHEGPVNDVKFHPYEPWAVSVGMDSKAISWSVPEWEKISEAEAPTGLWSIAIISSDNQVFTGGMGTEIFQWELPQLKFVQSLDELPTFATTLSVIHNLDGYWLGAGFGDGEALVINLSTGKAHLYSGHNSAVLGIRFHPTKDKVVTSSRDTSIHIWDMYTLETLQVLNGHQEAVFGLQYLEWGERLVSASDDRTIRVWDVQSGVSLHVYQGHAEGARRLEVHDDTLFSSSMDGTLKQWGNAWHEFTKIIKVREYFSIRSMDLGIGKAREIQGRFSTIAIHPETGKLALGSTDGGIGLYSLLGDKSLWDERSIFEEHEITAFAFDPKGNRLASGDADGSVKIWNADGELLTNYLGIFSGSKVNELLFTPDGLQLIIASEDGLVYLIDIEKGEYVELKPHEGHAVQSIDISRDGKRLVTSQNQNQVKAWNLETMPPVEEFAIQTDYPLTWAAISPNGEQVAVVGGSVVVEVYSWNNTSPPLRLEGHKHAVVRAQFSPTGRQLATLGADATLRFWNLDSGLELFSIPIPMRLDEINPVWDFDFGCAENSDNTIGHCWIVVPLTQERLVVYDLKRPYR